MPALSTQLLVIGGGATGLGIAWDATLRGLKVVLVEQGDLGQGTSGRYHGLLHSGARYVISDPTSAADCASENLILRRIVPHTIEDTGGLFVSLPTDPLDYPDAWLDACRKQGVPAEEISPAAALEREPLLNSRLGRAFLVQDAALDSFDLSHTLVDAIRRAGGTVWLRQRVETLHVESGRVVRADVRSFRTGEVVTVGAEVFVNAAGPFAGEVAASAGIALPLALGKGTMVAMAERLVHAVVNRCKPPADGDILVPIGTVCILGTTDTPVASGKELSIEPWEIDLLLAEGEALIPTLPDHRALRAWAGIRALYQPPQSDGQPTRTLPRAHAIIDHSANDGLAGLITVIGGKLTTFRLMAEETLDLVCRSLGVEAPCQTSETSLPDPAHGQLSPTKRLAGFDRDGSGPKPVETICECELVTRSDLATAIERDGIDELDDLRRDLRLGMGPCQAAFCAYRAAGIVHDLRAPHMADAGLVDFLNERWRGMRPLAWGHTLRQMELIRRIYLDLLCTSTAPEGQG